MVELGDTSDLGSDAERRRGSTPLTGTGKYRGIVSLQYGFGRITKKPYRIVMLIIKQLSALFTVLW